MPHASGAPPAHRTTDSTTTSEDTARSAAPARPIALIPEPDGIPVELRQRARWLVWCYELKCDWQTSSKPWTKVPYRSDGKGKAASNRPETWSDFEAAQRAYDTGDYDGFGFVTGDGIAAGDVDDCRDRNTGELTTEAERIITLVKTYTEISPSSEGGRFWAFTDADPGARKRRGNVELYPSKQYLTVTGHHVEGTPTTVENRTAELKAIHDKYLAPKPKPRSNNVPRKRSTGAGRLDDDEVLKRMKRAKPETAKLLDGDLGAHEGDHSRADQALVSHLAWWTDYDHAQVDRLFRASALMRDKWDEQRGELTYGERTIATAFEGHASGDGYQPRDPADLAPPPRDDTDPGPADSDVPSTDVAATRTDIAEDEPADEWPDPKPLPPAADEPGPIDPELLPEPLRPWLLDAAERASLPLEYFVPATLVALSGLIGNRVRVQPKRYDDFLVVPNLWGALVAHSGTMKSHAITAALAPIKPLERELIAEYEAKRQRQAGRREDLELQEAAILERRKQAAKSKSGTDRDSLQALRAELDDVRQELSDTELPQPELVVNDSTVEKLVELLRDNPRGLTMMRDELLGWLRSLEKQGRESDRTFYLEAWNGDQPFKQHRIGRGTTTVPVVTMALYGAIQPGAFRKYQTEAMADGEGADGLLQRFQLLIWPDENMQPYQHVDRAPDVTAQRRVLELCRRLYHLDLATLTDREAPAPFVGFGGASEGVEFAILRFDDEAQSLHDVWRTELENALRSPRARAHRAYLSQVSKYRSLFPSLAGLFHLIELVSHESGRQNRQKQERAAARTESSATTSTPRTDKPDKSRGRISLATAKRAAAMVEYLDAHARKVYADEVNAERAAASRLLHHVKQGHVRDGDTVRDLTRKEWSGLDRAQLDLGLDHLESLGWLRVERVATAGRPSYVVRLHPRIHDHLGGDA